MAGWIGVPAMADYCASKFAAVGFDESIRNELLKLGKTGVHTTCVCPSFINTGMFDGIRVKFPDIFPMVEPDWAADQVCQSWERIAITVHTHAHCDCRSFTRSKRTRPC